MKKEIKIFESIHIKTPRKCLDERIAEALTKALKPVKSRLDNIENTLKRNSLR